MAELGATIRETRQLIGWTQVEAAERTGVDKGNLSKRETGRLNLPHPEIERWVVATGIPLIVTPSGWSVYAPPTQDLPYYGRVPCGVPLLIEESAPEQVDLAGLTAGTWHDGQSYMVQADGDSMEPAIRDGDWLVVRRYGTRAPRLWDIVVAVVEGETVVAQIRHHPERWDRYTLGKLNERFSIDIDDGADVRLLGQVIGSLRWRPMRE